MQHDTTSDESKLWDSIYQRLAQREREILKAGVPEDIEALAAAKRGIDTLRHRRYRPRRTESPIEAQFLAAVQAAQVIQAEPQVRVGRYRVDFICRLPVGDNVVAVELDGYDWHERTREQAAADRRRDRGLLAAGYPVMRFTGREIHRDAAGCVREVHRQLLGLRG